MMKLDHLLHIYAIPSEKESNCSLLFVVQIHVTLQFTSKICCMFINVRKSNAINECKDLNNRNE
jgi:hypothetical protein